MRQRVLVFINGIAKETFFLKYFVIVLYFVLFLVALLSQPCKFMRLHLFILLLYAINYCSKGNLEIKKNKTDVSPIVVRLF